MESDLVLLRKGGPVSIFSVCFHLVLDQCVKVFDQCQHFPTWYFEMIVKSAALSSNQAVGVKKSLLDICEMKMTRSDWRTLGWQDRLLRWVPGWEGQNGRRTPLINSMLLSLFS